MIPEITGVKPTAEEMAQEARATEWLDDLLDTDKTDIITTHAVLNECVDWAFAHGEDTRSLINAAVAHAMDLVADCVINGAEHVLGEFPEGTTLDASDSEKPIDPKILVAARDWLAQIVRADGDGMPFRIAIMMFGDMLVNGHSVFTLIDLANRGMRRAPRPVEAPDAE